VNTTFSLQTQLAAAHERFELEQRLVAKAVEAESKARAEVSRLMMLHLAEEEPKITAYSWSISWEYDDEGGYYTSTNVYAAGLEAEYGWDDDALIEIGQYLDASAMTWLGPEDKEVTLDELKSMSI
jgi:hypothetical protein